MNKQTTIWM